MSLPAKAENVAVVRHALAGVADRIGMDEAGVADLKTVVTEACMNVVVHAYPDGDSGPLLVEAEPGADGLTVVVRDFGTGIRPRPDVERPSLRIGLTLIAALSSSFEIKGGVDRGTEIRMHLPLVARKEEAAPEKAPDSTPSQDTKLRIGPPELLPPVLSRALGALAARRESPSTGSPTRCCCPTRSPPMPPAASATVTSASASLTAPRAWSCGSARC